MSLLKTISRTFQLVITCIAVACMISCAGGGSRGTGGFEFQGRVLNENLTPLARVRITIAETGDSTLTDENGFYSLSTSFSAESVEYLIEGPGVTAQFVFAGIPVDAVALTLDFQVENEGTSVTPINVNIEVPEANPGPDPNDEQPEAMVSICHFPPGNPQNPQNITVGEPAVAAHLAHGDTLGACEQSDDGGGDNDDGSDNGQGNGSDNGQGNRQGNR